MDSPRWPVTRCAMTLVQRYLGASWTASDGGRRTDDGQTVDGRWTRVMLCSELLVIFMACDKAESTSGIVCRFAG